MGAVYNGMPCGNKPQGLQVQRSRKREYRHPMRGEFIDIYCAGLLGTKRTQPFGDETVIWTVHGHMFAAYTTDGEGLSLRLSDKALAQQVVGQGRAFSAPYLKGDAWVMFPWTTRPMELRDWLGRSYRLVLNDRNGA